MDMGGGPGMGMGMGMGGAAPSTGAAAAAHAVGGRKHFMHMTFYWGTQSEILFDGWPGARGGGMYALALAVVFALAVLVELLGSYLSTRGGRRGAAAVGAAAVHAARVGLAYVLMLALMSFNVGVLLAAVAGHAAGFLLFRGGLCSRRAQVDDGTKEYLAPAAGC